MSLIWYPKLHSSYLQFNLKITKYGEGNDFFSKDIVFGGPGRLLSEKFDKLYKPPPSNTQVRILKNDEL